MGAVLWLLHQAITLSALLGSFKALYKPTPRARRSAQAAVSTTLSSSDRGRRRRIKQQLQLWLVWATFCALEKWADRTVGWIIPFYEQTKVVLLFSILICRTAGAEMVYNKVMGPMLKHYERPMDALGFFLEEVMFIITAVLLYVPRWVLRAYRKRTAPEEVSSILVGLRSAPRAPLAHSLADTIESISTQIGQPIYPPTHPRRAPPVTAASVVVRAVRKPVERVSERRQRERLEALPSVRGMVDPRKARPPPPAPQPPPPPAPIQKLYPAIPPSIPVYVDPLPRSSQSLRLPSPPPSPPRPLTPPHSTPPRPFISPGRLAQTPAPPGGFNFALPAPQPLLRTLIEPLRTSPRQHPKPAPIASSSKLSGSPKRSLLPSLEESIPDSPRQKALASISELSLALSPPLGSGSFGGGAGRGRSSMGISSLSTSLSRASSMSTGNLVGKSRSLAVKGKEKEVIISPSKKRERASTANLEGETRGEKRGKVGGGAVRGTKKGEDSDYEEEGEEEEEEEEEGGRKGRLLPPRRVAKDKDEKRTTAGVRRASRVPTTTAGTTAGRTIPSKTLKSSTSTRALPAPKRTVSSRSTSPVALKKSEDVPTPRKKPRRLLGVQRGEANVEEEMDGVPIVVKRRKAL